MTTLNTTKAVFLIGAILALSFLALSGIVKAAGDFYCEDYARTAVKQYQELISNKCSYDKNDPKWNSDKNYHTSWCLGLKVTEAMCNEGTSQRAQAIAICKGQAFDQTLHQSCEEYATRSANQNRSNIGNNCKFSGPEWNSDKFYHYDWCVKYRISQNELNNHLANRDVKLTKCLPYQTMEKNEKSFVVYISDEEGRFINYASGFMNEFKSTWKLKEYSWGDCRLIGADHLNFVDSADLAFLVGHGNVSRIKLSSTQSCDLKNLAWGSYTSSLRTGDLEYIVFMSCLVLKAGDSYNWRDRWRHYSSTKDDNRPFYGLHMAMGFSDNHFGTGDTGGWEADEFAENLKEGLPVRLAWYEAIMDYRWLATYLKGYGNSPVTLYIRPHRDETLDGHDSRDYKYGDPEYLLDAFYNKYFAYDPGGSEPIHEPVPDPTSWW